MKNWKEIFGDEEWEYIKRIGASILDPEDKRAFWENMRSRKEADPGFSVYSLFPKEEKTQYRDSEAKRLADKYAKTIIARLKGMP